MSIMEPYTLKPVEHTPDIERRDGELALVFPDFDDPNFDKEEAIAGILEDDSPYPEVRSAVANTDDPDIPVSTIRSWVLGLIFAVIAPGLNQFLYFRYPTVMISWIITQLLIFPFGCLWARTMPNVKIFGAPLNPGVFSIKEHVMATVMASVSSQSYYAYNTIAVQRFFYNQNYGFGYQWMLVMSTQLIGFSISGFCHRFLVNPPSMIWPSTLVSSALFNTLHAKTYAGIGHHSGISRGRFFLYCFAGSAVWYLVPGYLFEALSYFSWVCWIAPNNILINEVFGHVHGLGMSLITFDWSQMTYLASPLAAPWWTLANQLAGFFFFFWFLGPLLHHTNFWSGKFMPIISSDSYDNRGHVYNVSRILDDDATFNQQKYEAYSPLFISTGFAMTYGQAFASTTAILVHTLLYFRKHIVTQWTTNNHSDIHSRLMSRYRRVPEWWYVTIFLVTFAFGVAVIEGWPTKFPIQWFIFAIVIASIYVIPVGMLWGLTGNGQRFPMNFLSELIIGYGLPGRPIAMMLFKSWSFNTMYHALVFVGNFKLGHYMKIPPRTMFCSQVVGTVIASTVQLSVQVWMFSNIPGICDPSQRDGFICPQPEVFGTASIIWGVIGPARQFSKGQIYYGLPLFCVVGALCPLVAYLIGLKLPNSFIRYVNFPVVFGAVSMPPGTPLNFVSGSIVGFIFQYVIRRRHFSWWAKYDYVLSAALDSGVAVSALLIYFILLYPNNGTIGKNTIQGWWGNTVFKNTADFSGKPLLKVAEGSYFGPDTWH